MNNYNRFLINDKKLIKYLEIEKRFFHNRFYNYLLILKIAKNKIINKKDVCIHNRLLYETQFKFNKIICKNKLNHNS